MKQVYTFTDLQNWAEVTSDCNPPLRLAVIGDPVAHSASPPMHNAALESLGLPLRYTRLHIRPEELKEALDLLPAAGFMGINCTIPHKTAVLEALADLDESALRAGGVNTLVIRANGQLKGYSTDGPGFSRAVMEVFGAKLCSFRVLICGAGGGAGRAIATQCAVEGCPRIILVNRTAEKLQSLTASLNSLHPAGQVTVGGMDQLTSLASDADLIVNCTALGMKADDPSPVAAEAILPSHFVYDTIYVGRETPLQRAAMTRRARHANGLSMLLHQGALALEHWLGQTAPIEAMRSGLLAFVK